MRRRLTILALAALAMLGAPAHAETLRIATWNLGWHVSEAELSPWLTQCGKTYAKDAQGVWRTVPTGTPQAKRGWEIDESRPVLEGVDLSVMPPCAVYLTPAHQGCVRTRRQEGPLCDRSLEV